jgi:hypothetical protein
MAGAPRVVLVDLHVDGLGPTRGQRCLCTLEPGPVPGAAGALPDIRDLEIVIFPDPEVDGEGMLDFKDDRPAMRERALVEEAIAAGRLRVEGIAPALAALLPAGAESRQVRVKVRLASAIPFPFTPYLLAPARPGDAPFEACLAAAMAGAAPFPVAAASTREEEDCWVFFPGEIGGGALLVERRSGRLHRVASHALADLDAVLWGWREGVALEGQNDLVVLRVADREATHRFLFEFFTVLELRGVMAALGQPPVRLARLDLRMRLPQLQRARREGWFDFRVDPPGPPGPADLTPASPRWGSR